MRFQLAQLPRRGKAIIAGTVVLALFIVAPAALSKPGGSQSGVILQVVTPDVTVAATDNSASEAGADTGTFTISRTGATTDALTVNYSITGTATNGTDYTTLLASVSIPVGQASATVVVTPTDDATHEDAETVILTVTSGTGYAVGAPSGATVTISDNDLPAVSVTASDANAAEAGSNNGAFTVARTGSTTQALTVTYALTGTATNGTDYSLLTTSVVIPVGQPSATITVTPSNDGVAEPAETVILTISANALYTVGSPAAATVTITDDDLPTVTIDATDDSAAEAGSSTGTFTVSRTGDLTGALTVNYTISGSATNGSDYASLSGSVVIAANSASATVVVTPVDDAIDENNETVVLTLAAGSGYQIGGANNDTVTIADNDGPAVTTVTIDATDASAAEAGSATGTFTVTRTGDLTGALTVNYTISGSATNGSDYASLSGSVVIAASAASATVVVTPVDDAIDENNETVVLTLAAGSGYQIGGANNDTVTIADNDGTANPPGNGSSDEKDQCKKGGWKTFGNFKNQGDCVSWFATGGKNPPAG